MPLNGWETDEFFFNFGVPYVKAVDDFGEFMIPAFGPSAEITWVITWQQFRYASKARYVANDSIP